MIERVLDVLRTLLNEQLGRGADDSEDRVVFPSGEKPELELKLGAVTMLLVRIEEETVLRSADRYVAVGSDGTGYRVAPSIRLNLFVLLASRQRLYSGALATLSQVIGFFQQNRVLDRTSTPLLDRGIERVSIDLVTLPLSEQNDLWGALGCSYQPSVLYRVGVLVLADAQPQPSVPIAEVSRVLQHAG